MLWNGMTTGGSDVLLFFDFMSLPQIGQLSDGSLIERTEDEKELFFEALPAMGAMYAIYQVLVIPEVSRDVHPYFSSGWCFSEFCTALLSQKLEQLSSKAIDEYIAWLAATDDCALSADTLRQLNIGTLTEESVSAFLCMFDADLVNKKLFNEDDRPTIGGIVQGYLLKRLLTDAVRNQDEAGVKRYLAAVAEQQLDKTLDHAVDESLDTLLHIAVKFASVEIVHALLDAGADPIARNIRGDTPSQLHMLPRPGAGARLCRAWALCPANVYHELATGPSAREFLTKLSL